jgi:hypothetical protein
VVRLIPVAVEVSEWADQPLIKFVPAIGEVVHLLIEYSVQPALLMLAQRLPGKELCQRTIKRLLCKLEDVAP